MFNNLIESTSHAREFKRRGSFLLFTTATYVVLFVVTGVISIYAYDARLEEQSLEIVTLISPQDIAPEPDPAPASQPDRPQETSNNPNAITERATPMLSVNHPEVPPPTVGTTPNVNLPMPDHRPWALTGRDYTPGPPGGPGSDGGRVIAPPRQVVPVDDTPPPPPETPKPPKVVRLSPTVLVSRAISLPRPNYPPMAKQIHLQGSVNVQVFIDETGKVISAKAISGHPLFVPDAQRAAMQARFSPTMIGDQAVKVSGVITYNFVLGN
jgi:protein TonB